MVTYYQIEQCVEVARKFGAKKLVLFGSATNDMEHARDIDLFCYGLDGITILKMAAEMETSAGISVDVIPADQETPFINLNLSKGRLLYDSARAA